MKQPLYIDCCWGLGDNIYCRPFIRAAAERFSVWLGTPWPELFEDLPIRFVYRQGKLRTQSKNIASQPIGRWSLPPIGSRVLPRVAYRASDFAIGSIVDALTSRFHAFRIEPDPFVFDAPDFGPVPIKSRARPLAVVRPATVRGEWRNPARNPLPEYLEALSRRLWQTHTVVSIADLADGHEWLLQPAPRAHVTLHKGELKVRELLALVQHADVVIGGVGWIVPASIALKTKAFIVLGGHGGHNAPEKITDPRMDLSRIGFATPERFCRCTNMQHDCNKTILDLDRQFLAWTKQVGLHCSAAWPTAA
jgi:hypothetical protein